MIIFDKAPKWVPFIRFDADFLAGNHEEATTSNI